MTRKGACRPARSPNGSRFTVTGRRIKLDRGEGLICVEVCPAVASTAPFVVAMQASSEVLRLDASALYVQVTGWLLTPGKGILLAEHVANGARACARPSTCPPSRLRSMTALTQGP
ncbi:hypothetical protein [Deinococcus hopiensis]|nr:hypothetical protein [Deinococcus hopiensis]